MNLIKLMERLQNEFNMELEKHIFQVKVTTSHLNDRVVNLENIREAFCKARNRVMREEITG